MATDPDLEPNIWQVWDRAYLQRCHLVPDALGGPDTPENLVLLCSNCHSEAPDVADAEYMLRWIDAHESWGHHFITAIKAALVQLSIEEHQIEAFNRLEPEAMMEMTASIIRDWAIPVAGRFSYATMAACAVEGVRRASAIEP
jgi:HNH endonuclease